MSMHAYRPNPELSQREKLSQPNNLFSTSGISAGGRGTVQVRSLFRLERTTVMNGVLSFHYTSFWFSGGEEPSPPLQSSSSFQMFLLVVQDGNYTSHTHLQNYSCTPMMDLSQRLTLTAPRTEPILPFYESIKQ